MRSTRSFPALMIALFSCLFASASKPTGSIAMVADLEGKVTLDGGRSLRLLDEIAPGRTLTLNLETRLVLVDLSNGDERIFKGPGRLTFDSVGRSQGLRPRAVHKHPALSGLRLRLGGLAQVAVVMRSAQAIRSLEVLPKGPMLLESAPEFRWEALSSQATYQFKLFDARGGLLLDRTLPETRLQAPELRPGEACTWILEARLPEQAPRVSTGKVQVLDVATRELLVKFKPIVSAPFTERLVYAALLEDAQIGDEARKAWTALAQERPNDARLKALALR